MIDPAPNNRPRILIVSYHYPPENVPAVQRAVWWKRYLPDFGYEADVLASSKSPWFYGATVSDPNQGIFRAPEDGQSQEWLRKLSILNNIAQSRLHFADYGLAWVRFANRAAGKLAKQRNYQAVVTTSPSVGAHFVGHKLQRQRGIPWIADFQDPLSDNTATGRSAFGKWWNRRIERRWLQAADFIIANTEPVERLWQERWPRRADRITHIWNGYDEQEPLPPPDRDPQAPQVLAYVGGLYSGRNPSPLFDAYWRLVEKGKLDPARFKLKFVGVFDFAAVDDPEKVREMVSRGYLEMTNAFIPRPDALREAVQASYLLVLSMENAQAELQVPSKLYDYIRIGHPILALTAPQSPIQAILAKSGVPHRILPFREATPERMEQTLLELQTIPPGPHPVSDWFRENFEARSLTRKLAGILDKAT